MSFATRPLIGRTLCFCALLVLAGCGSTARMTGLALGDHPKPLAWPRDRLVRAKKLVAAVVRATPDGVSASKPWPDLPVELGGQLVRRGYKRLSLGIRHEGDGLVVSDGELARKLRCRSLRHCFLKLRRWAHKRPSHLPVFVFVDARAGFDAQRLEAELARTFPRAMLLTASELSGALDRRDLQGRFAFVLSEPAPTPEGPDRPRSD